MLVLIYNWCFGPQELPCDTAQHQTLAAQTTTSRRQLPNVDHIPALAIAGMSIVMDLRLENAVPSNIAKLGYCQMLTLAEAFQVYCHTGIVL